MSGPYETEDDIKNVVLGFESCATAKDGFSHADHLAVAVWYLRQDERRALDLMRASLHRFLDHYDCRANYHETLTRFWIELVKRRLWTLPLETALLEATNSVVGQLNNSQIAFDYYSKNVVESPRARQVWIEPDLKKIE